MMEVCRSKNRLSVLVAVVLPMVGVCTLWIGGLWFSAQGMAIAAEADSPVDSAKLAVLPAEIVLDGPSATQQLIAERIASGLYVGEVVEGVQWSSSDEGVAKVVDGVVVPVGNGRATVTASVGQDKSTASVEVRQSETESPVTFRNHVQSVLSKAGCNTGACHGAEVGKNGFRLSLRGYNSDGDFAAITRQARGRRIAPDDPARSMMLTKPTGAIPHKGGVRFDVNSLEYKTIARWIAAGAMPPASNDPHMTRLEILPDKVTVKPSTPQRLVVRAHFSDGRVEDVTKLAKFSSSNESVATVDQQGRLTIAGFGEGFIGAWYLSQNVVATVTSPYKTEVAAEVYAQSARRNFIDDLVLTQLQRLNIPPSPRASDSEFLRRSFIDTIGTLPTADEARQFLADQTPDKRDRLIDQLLARPEFVDYWTYKWSDLFLVNSERLNAPAMWSYYRWIRTQVANNRPWDQIARDMITATGSTLENGAANFFILHGDATVLAETTSQAFLGMSINCAKCHNHPLEKWTNDQYYGMANLFSRVRVKAAAGDGNSTVFVADQGELLLPRTGKPELPRPLDSEALPFDSPMDRREFLADWLTSPENPYFARAITNRVWANFLGVGLVEAVDDLRLTNPASNEALLNAAAEYLIKNKYDLKVLMRAILQSETYQRSSQTLPGNLVDRRYYSRYYPRRMMAEVMLDGISQISGTPTDFRRQSGDAINRQADPNKLPKYPESFRAIQLPDSNVLSYFLKSFGRAQRLLTCECERSDEPSMVQVLHLANGETINDKLAAPNSKITKILASKQTDAEIIEDAYLSVFSRMPTDEERLALSEQLAQAKPEDRREVLEDLYWSLLSSKEFLLNR
ncbi:MAG: DUF1553 domain-containing protein [Planctomycetota bacterium]|nr:DUF1553 domain-containing protein [Planctomycetota bacterium]